MKRLINITAKAATAILAVALTASCVFEKDDAVRGNDRGMNNVLVQIGVSADGMTQTKADVIPGNDQAGEGVETAISTLRLYAYIGNVLSGYAYVPEYSATDKIYMDLKNLPSSGTQQVEFVAVANEGSMTGIDGIHVEVGKNPDGTISLSSNFGRNSFEGLKYTIANQEFTAIVDEKEKVVGMPMYATKTVTIDVDRVGNKNAADGHNGHFILADPVNLELTRSLAKIEVYAAESASATTAEGKTEDTSVTITGVSLANVPASGNLFTAPAADASITYATFKDAEGNETAYSTSFLKAGTVSKKVNNKVDTDIKNPDNYTLVSNAYYLAENNQGDEATYDFGATDYTTGDAATKATVLKIDYSLDEGKTFKSGYVKMPQIKRNTWYKVLARIQANGEIELVFVVKPWNVDKTVLTYSDVISITTPAAWSFEDSNNASFDDQKGEVSLRTSTDSYFTFKIDQPAGATWTATLIPISGQLDSFKFIENGSEVSTVTGDVGTSETLTIRPTGSPDAENNVASLRITIKTKEGNTKFVTPSELLKNSDVSYKEFTIIHSN